MALARNILAVVLGLAVGGVVNMGLVVLGPMIIAPPAGVDVTSQESMQAGIHLFEARHFLFPFLAHALGTLIGALVTSLLAVSRRTALALLIGGFFLAGGISVATMIPAPAWFTAIDLIVAYLPCAWLGSTLGLQLRKAEPSERGG